MEDVVVELAQIFHFAPMKSVEKPSYATEYTYTLMTLPFPYTFPINTVTLLFSTETKTLPQSFVEEIRKEMVENVTSRIYCNLSK